MTNFDSEVIIIGCGPVGATLAGLLGSKGISCIVVDSREAVVEVNAIEPDPRVLALTYASKRIFKSFDLWRQIPEERIGRFQKMHVWDENGNGEIQFDCAELSETSLGYTVEQSVLQHTLDRILDYIPAVSIQRGERLSGLRSNADNVIVKLGDRELNARLAIAADGIHSRTRELAGIQYGLHDYAQSAIACIVKTELAHQDVASQRFLTNGPLAFLPMFEPNQCGIVWSTKPVEAEQLLAMDEQEFKQNLQSGFESKLGAINECGSRVSFPLQRAQAEQYCQERLALIGDAAHCVHPLTGQGANLGILDAACLAQVLIEARDKQRDFGSKRVLRRYERWRRGENFIMMMAFEGLKNLFESKIEPLPYLRNTGLNIVNSNNLIKHFFIRRAIGLEGELPAIAKA